MPISFKFSTVCLIHTVKDFSIVNEAEVGVFPEFSCFFLWFSRCYLISVYSIFSKSSLCIPKFLVRILLKPSLEEIWAYLYKHVKWVQMYGSLNLLGALPFFGIGMKNNLSQSCGHCWVFQTCWYIKCSTLTASSFRIWNSSATSRRLSPVFL